MGAAPADDPEIAIYVVVDRPNVAEQSTSTRLATTLVRNILTEALPYLNYPMTEELSEKELAELQELREKLITTVPETPSEDVTEGLASAENEETNTEQTENTDEQALAAEGDQTNEERSSIWETFDRDAQTGYYVDPETGAQFDPDTRTAIGEDVLPDYTEGLPGLTSEEN